MYPVAPITQRSRCSYYTMFVCALCNSVPPPLSLRLRVRLGVRPPPSVTLYPHLSPSDYVCVSLLVPTCPTAALCNSVPPPLLPQTTCASRCSPYCCPAVVGLGAGGGGGAGGPAAPARPPRPALGREAPTAARGPTAAAQRRIRSHCAADAALGLSRGSEGRSCARALSLTGAAVCMEVEAALGRLNA